MNTLFPLAKHGSVLFVDERFKSGIEGLDADQVFTDRRLLATVGGVSCPEVLNADELIVWFRRFGS